MRCYNLFSLCIFVLLQIINFSCRENKLPESQITSLDVTVLFDDPKQVTLSQISELYKLVPLETTAESIIGGIGTNLLFADGDYYVDYNFLIYRFSKDGSFLNTIGRIGRGPGEYIRFWGFDVSGCGRYVAVLSSNNVHIYSKEGVFLRSFTVEKNAQSIALFDEMVVTYSEHTHKAAEYSFCFYSMEGVKLNCLPLYQRFVNPTMVHVVNNPVSFYKNDGSLFAKELMGDTIYRFSESTPSPHMVLNTGEHRLTPEKRSEVSSFTGFITTSWMFQIGDYLMARFSFQRNGLLILHNSNTKETYAINPTGGIADDMVSNTRITRFFPSYADSSVMYVINANDYLEYKKDKEILSETNITDAARIDQMSNPVIVKIKLKDIITF